MRLKAENVFKPGAYPEYTYVSRNYENTGISYELRLKRKRTIVRILNSLQLFEKIDSTNDTCQKSLV